MKKWIPFCGNWARSSLSDALPSIPTLISAADIVCVDAAWAHFAQCAFSAVRVRQRYLEVEDMHCGSGDAVSSLPHTVLTPYYKQRDTFACWTLLSASRCHACFFQLLSIAAAFMLEAVLGTSWLQCNGCLCHSWRPVKVLLTVRVLLIFDFVSFDTMISWQIQPTLQLICFFYQSVQM